MKGDVRGVRKRRIKKRLKICEGWKTRGKERKGKEEKGEIGKE